jgi:hypothetical protein
MQDVILDGKPLGDVANEFAESGYNSGLYQPYVDREGNKCVTVNVGRHYDATKGRDVTTYEKMTLNEARFRGYDAPTLYLTNATILRKDEWISFDRAVVEAARPRLRVWSDLAAANTYTLDGMSSEILEHETINDPGEAQVDMDGLSDGRADSVLYQLEGLPLPITYGNFHFSERKLSISRKSGQPLSTLMASIIGRRVAETIEKTTIGTTTGLTYGTTANYGRAPTVYGYTNHPARNYGTNLTAPTGSNPDTTLSEILTMRSTLYTDGFMGPYVIYNGTDWDAKLDDDYFVLATTGATAPTRTLRERLKAIEGIQDVRRADYLTPTNTGGTFDLLMVSLGNPECARAVIGMPIRILQWPSRGGMQLNFKVMCIMAPQIRADYNGASGINHESVT